MAYPIVCLNPYPTEMGYAIVVIISYSKAHPKPHNPAKIIRNRR